MIVKENLENEIKISVNTKTLHTNFNRLHSVDINIFINQEINTFAELQGNLELTSSFF
jgi:hypothetical protein